MNNNQTVPPSINVNHYVLSYDGTTIYVTQGRTRFVIGDQGEGVVHPAQVIEWVHTLALTPTAAYQLCMGLSDACSRYAAAYGAIPLDKDFTVRLAGGENEAVN